MLLSPYHKELNLSKIWIPDEIKKNLIPRSLMIQEHLV